MKIVVFGKQKSMSPTPKKETLLVDQFLILKINN